MSQVKPIIGGELGGRIAIETITPDRAKAILADRNWDNRSMKPAAIERYKKAMLEGTWLMNGESIKFSDKGELIDGQNRLQACVEAGVPFTTVVIYDLPTDTKRTIDNGVNRTLGDLLQWKGVANANVIGGAAAYVMVWERLTPDMPLPLSRPSGGGKSGISSLRPSRDDKFEWILKSDHTIWDQAAKLGVRMRGLYTPSVGAALSYLVLSGWQDGDGEGFLEKVASGMNIFDEGDPAGVLRSRLIRESRAERQASGWEKLAWGMKAWSQYRRGKTGRLVIRPSEKIGDL